jgi:tetratricopeptide (TPR) repeat protein
MDVLEHAISRNPRDARARYYLGNLLYDHQPAEAIKAWEASREIDSFFCTVHRNLGLAYARFENDLPKALASMEKAAACDPQDPRVLAELDQVSEQAGVSPEKRLARLEEHQPVVLERDDAVQQEITLYVQLGQYDKAIDLLGRRHFHVWEGGGEIHDIFISAHLLRGQEAFRSQHYREALRDFQAALEYPENLEVGKPLHPQREPEIEYSIGTGLEALGNGAQASAAYEKAAAAIVHLPEARYYQGLALSKLGQGDKAAGIFADLLKTGERELAATSDLDYFAKFGEKRSEAARVAHAHYLMGLGYLGQGKRAEAKTEFEKVLEKNANHLGARTQLAALR